MTTAKAKILKIKYNGGEVSEYEALHISKKIGSGAHILIPLKLKDKVFRVIYKEGVENEL